MSKRNYQTELDSIILAQGDHRPKVLLHSCCGPCSSSVLEYLTQFFEVTLLWYNPNLYPEEEYTKRLETQKKLLRKMGLTDAVKIIEEPWQSEDYYRAAKGYENEPEGGRRCTECFRLRLRKTAELAKKGNYDFFCTTLTLSRYKDAVRINTLGEEIGAAEGIKWLPSDFKKQGREMRSSELAKKYDLYRQQYCGCEFSLKNRREKEENTGPHGSCEGNITCTELRG